MKRLTEKQFNQAVDGLGVGDQTKEIARGVLVDGKSQAEYVKALDLTRGAVSQAVKRVWEAHLAKAEVPEGYERVTVILPKFQALQVKKWAKSAENQ
ncbi:transcriptional regulator [Methylomonas sp. Kb3]|uniref:TrfB-related DNA-binding protein n=1 Tax=Methylomonas sp. Kb3 TaxID=1611544 RepID=UPI000C340C97|nr:TrfB-related DNA-binding protein [Methylomonas sp. Kb3]PKD40498.1 transcriptional regulator [Methylomonas sp. Kb3]